MIFLSVIVLFSLIGTVTLNAAFTVTDDVYGGVRVGGIDVGGLTLPAAESKIAAAFQGWTQHDLITLVYKDKRWMIVEIVKKALGQEAVAI
jgi:hypothetical protein